ncbi:helix-turn-helix domain-containing protein [Actinomadura gamaensis]|uniref:Helix-turn-helix domain-containing protein n=1 Tax=Actinomadura gamaensis TaxID=1763541 RepID=A0ABV9TT31_9ACTN
MTPLSQWPRGGPTVLRILLGAQLRRLRENRGIGRDEAGYAIRASDSKISRMELGRVSFKQRDIDDLLTLYGVTDPAERAPLLELAREANSPGWWHRYGDVLPPWFETYLGLEEAASVVRIYESHFVPGLLQSEDYARTIARMGQADASDADVERHVRLQAMRQRRFAEPDAPTLWAVLDEAVLRRPVGDRGVMRGQVRHLIEMAHLPNVTLQILPFAFRASTLVNSPFTILRFAEPDLSDVVYLEQLTSALYLDKPSDLDMYGGVMNNISLSATGPGETMRFLMSLLA